MISCPCLPQHAPHLRLPAVHCCMQPAVARHDVVVISSLAEALHGRLAGVCVGKLQDTARDAGAADRAARACLRRSSAGSIVQRIELGLVAAGDATPSLPCLPAARQRRRHALQSPDPASASRPRQLPAALCRAHARPPPPLVTAGRPPGRRSPPPAAAA